jgi:hypothetical protein
MVHCVPAALRKYEVGGKGVLLQNTLTRLLRNVMPRSWLNIKTFKTAWLWTRRHYVPSRRPESFNEQYGVTPTKLESTAALLGEPHTWHKTGFSRTSSNEIFLIRFLFAFMLTYWMVHGKAARSCVSVTGKVVVVIKKKLGNVRIT